MKVEEINNSEASTMAADATAMEIVEKMELKGQRKLCNPETATRFPYPVMSKSQNAVFSALFPEREPIQDYEDAIIPVRVLQVAAYAKDFPQAAYLEVWHSGSAKEDPILVGRKERYSGSNYMLARWGDALPTFEEMKKKARKIAATTILLEINKGKSKLSEFENSIDALTDLFLETGEKPHINIYY